MTSAEQHIQTRKDLTAFEQWCTQVYLLRQQNWAAYQQKYADDYQGKGFWYTWDPLQNAMKDAKADALEYPGKAAAMEQELNLLISTESLPGPAGGPTDG